MPIHEPDEDDPLEFQGIMLPGDTTEAMAEVFVEEYMLSGSSDAAILFMFKNPFYAAPHMVYRAKGEAYVKDLITRVRTGWSPAKEGRDA